MVLVIRFYLAYKKAKNQKNMPNNPIRMNKLRTIIRLYGERMGLSPLVQCRTSLVTQ